MRRDKHVKIYRRDDRGFHGYGKPMECTYKTNIEVYESSSAEGPHVWLNLREDPVVFDQMSPGHAVAHLNEKQAIELIRRLNTWLDEIPRRWR